MQAVQEKPQVEVICPSCGMSRTALLRAAREGDVIAQEMIRYAKANCECCKQAAIRKGDKQDETR